MSLRGLSNRENIPTSATNVAAITNPTPLKSLRIHNRSAQRPGLGNERICSSSSFFANLGLFEPIEVTLKCELLRRVVELSIA